MLYYVPWDETYIVPDGWRIIRHHDLLFDSYKGMYVGEFINGISYVGFFISQKTYVPEYKLYASF